MQRVLGVRSAWTLAGERQIPIKRDQHGVPHVYAQTEADLYRGVGHCHAVDRGLQMLLTRIIGQGRASEILDASDDMLRLDRFFRRLNLAAGAEEEMAKTSERARALALAYCEGVNHAFAERIPWELKLLGYTPTPWTFADLVLGSRMIGFVGLAQSQGEMERLVIEMVHAGVSRAHLEELFPGQLGGLDPALIGRVTLGERLVPPALAWTNAVPRAVASNNWAIAPRKTANGTAIFANDPHLEVNRLPNVWYEIVVELLDRYCMGTTVPGLPGLLLGRNKDLAWGATYSFLDGIDSWIEDCRDGRYRRMTRKGGRDRWVPFTVRTEVIKRKRKADITTRFYENDHGVLDGDATAAGLYLATRWASGAGTGAASLEATFDMLHATDVETGMRNLGRIETSFNWVLADRHGNIGYQMSGRMPLRRDGVTGLVPLPGWDAGNDWHGFAEPEDLPRVVNPESGFVVTANDDLNHLGRRHPINVPMGPYRRDRITALLAARDDWTAADVEAMQMDVCSLHAERFMTLIRPLLPITPAADILRSWDCRYDPASVGATLFERFYRGLVREVFGAVLGAEVMRHVAGETAILADFYWNLDRILLADDSVWFGGESRDAIYHRVLGRSLDGPLTTWGSEQRVLMKHLLFGGRFPVWLGFDYGPVALRGNRATIHQGQVYRSGGRVTSFAPTYRMVTDLGEESIATSMAGGPSDRRFSPWYTSGMDDWLAGRFKRLTPGPALPVDE
jgi:penicillin G amidase